MLAIRLRRAGKKGQPIFRIVVAENSAPIQGKYIANVGNYNPKTKALTLKKEEILSWLVKGAKPSNTVSKLLTKEEIQHPSIVVKKFRAVSKKELAAQKAQEEAEKEKIQAEKEAAKAAFEEKVEAEKAAEPSSEEKLQAAADENIKEIKTEETQKPAPEIKETKEVTETKEEAKKE